MDLRGYLSVLRRHLLLILAFATLGAGTAALATARMAPVFESSARVFVSSAQADTTEAYAGGLLAQQRVASYAILVDSRVLAADVKDELGLDLTLEQLVEKVESSNLPDTVVLELRVTDGDPGAAQLLAQTYAEQLVERARDIETPSGSRSATIEPAIIDPASPAEQVSPRPLLNLVVGVGAGLLIGVCIALVRQLLDTTVKSSDDLLPITSAPVLGSIPLSSSARRDEVLGTDPPRVEAFRMLRTNIQFVDVDNPHKVFVVTSPVQGEGKSATAVNLAASLAQAGVKVLLMDGDLRRPKVAAYLGLDASTGVTTVLLGRVTLEDAIQRHTVTDLDVLASGVTPPNAAELLQSKAMAGLLAKVRSRYDIVIVDAPPLLPVTDAALLSSQADGAIMIIRYGRTTRDRIVTATERLTAVDANVVGAVLNMVPASRSSESYSYKVYGARSRDRRIRR